MKIWNLPPKYIDTTTLQFEFQLAKDTFDKIIRYHHSLFRKPDSRLVRKYKNYHAFLLVRMDCIADELVKRKKRVDFDISNFLPKLEDENWDYPIMEDMIQRDIDSIMNMWGEYLDEDKEIEKLIEQLQLTDSDTLLSELSHLYEQYKQEYFG